MAEKPFDCWIDTYVNNSNHFLAPKIYYKWGAISAVSTIAQHCFQLQVVENKPTIPNLFIFLVGNSSAGKSVVIDNIEDILGYANHPCVISTEGSLNGILKKFGKIGRSYFTLDGDPHEYHAGLFISSEFANFLPTSDFGMLSTLSKLWDGADYTQSFVDDTKSKKLKKCYLSLLAGIQPAMTRIIFPMSAWGQGFCNRVIWVTSDQKRVRSKEFFETKFDNKISDKRFGKELADIRKLAPIGRGLYDLQEMTIDDTARKFQLEVFLNIQHGIEDIIFPKYAEAYVERRYNFIMKISMCFALSQKKIIIEESHIRKAVEALSEVEKLYTTHIFPNVYAESRDSYDIIEDMVVAYYLKSGVGILKNQLLFNLRRRMAYHDLVTGVGAICSNSRYFHYNEKKAGNIIPSRTLLQFLKIPEEDMPEASRSTCRIDLTEQAKSATVGASVKPQQRSQNDQTT